MKTLLALTMTALLASGGLAAAVEPVGQEPSWEDKVEGALDKPVSFTWKNQALPDVLDAIGKAAAVTVVLDPAAIADPATVKISLSISRESGMTLRSALGNVLKMAGLRYTLKDQAIFVSTRDRIVTELLAGETGPVAAVPGVSYPMTAGDAVAASVDFFDGSEESIPVLAGDFLRMPVDARFERPAYRDAQGRLHFPAPPTYIQGPEILNPNYRFSTTPVFLKPEYLAPLYWGPESQRVGRDEVRDTEALKALIHYMQKHPELTVGQLIQQLEAAQVKK